MFLNKVPLFSSGKPSVIKLLFNFLYAEFIISSETAVKALVNAETCLTAYANKDGSTLNMQCVF